MYREIELTIYMDFLPGPLCKYSHDTIVLLAWVAKSLFTTITLYPLLFVQFEKCGAPDNNTKNLCAIEFNKHQYKRIHGAWYILNK